VGFSPSFLVSVFFGGRLVKAAKNMADAPLTQILVVADRAGSFRFKKLI